MSPYIAQLMNSQASPPQPTSFKKKLLIAFCILLGLGGIAAASVTFWYQHNFNASPFKGVQLSQPERQVLEQKVAIIKKEQLPAPVTDPAKTLVLSEREINGFLQEQGLGNHLKVSIGGGSMSASALIPVDKEVPFIGGHTVRVKITLSPKLDDNHRMALYLSNLTIGGISPPNAWLGDIKGANLFDYKNDPLMKRLSDGIKDLQVQEGEIRVILND